MNMKQRHEGDCIASEILDVALILDNYPPDLKTSRALGRRLLDLKHRFVAFENDIDRREWKIKKGIMQLFKMRGGAE